VFDTPFEVSLLRLLLKEPNDKAEDFEYVVDVFCCYDEILKELGNCIAR
jgi:hypothetical protein